MSHARAGAATSLGNLAHHTLVKIAHATVAVFSQQAALPQIITIPQCVRPLFLTSGPIRIWISEFARIDIRDDRWRQYFGGKWNSAGKFKRDRDCLTLRPIVRSEYQQRIVIDAKLLQRVEDLADVLVAFHQLVAVIADARFAR